MIVYWQVDILEKITQPIQTSNRSCHIRPHHAGHTSDVDEGRTKIIFKVTSEMDNWPVEGKALTGEDRAARTFASKGTIGMRQALGSLIDWRQYPHCRRLDGGESSPLNSVLLYLLQRPRNGIYFTLKKEPSYCKEAKRKNRPFVDTV